MQQSVSDMPAATAEGYVTAQHQHVSVHYQPAHHEHSLALSAATGPAQGQSAVGAACHPYTL